MQLCVLGSGSRGNCVLVMTRTTRVLIDAGLRLGDVRARAATAGIALDRADAVLITHEHHDHVQAVSTVAHGLGAAIHVTAGTHDAALRRFQQRDRIAHFDAAATFEIGDLSIEPVRKPHDAADAVGFLIHSVVDGVRETVGCFTDLGSVDAVVGEAISRCTALVMESNHDPAMLRAGPYPAMLRVRVASDVGHLSNAQSAAAIAKYATPRLRHLVLAHLSAQNNTTELVRRAFIGALGAPSGLVRRLSLQDKATALIDVTAAGAQPHGLAAVAHP